MIHDTEESDLFGHHAKGAQTSDMCAMPHGCHTSLQYQNGLTIMISAFTIPHERGSGEIDADAANLTHPCVTYRDRPKL